MPSFSASARSAFLLRSRAPDSILLMLAFETPGAAIWRCERFCFSRRCRTCSPTPAHLGSPSSRPHPCLRGEPKGGSGRASLVRRNFEQGVLTLGGAKEDLTVYECVRACLHKLSGAGQGRKRRAEAVSTEGSPAPCRRGLRPGRLPAPQTMPAVTCAICAREHSNR
jgi:hypothetical protein